MEATPPQATSASTTKGRVRRVRLHNHLKPRPGTTHHGTRVTRLKQARENRRGCCFGPGCCRSARAASWSRHALRDKACLYSPTLDAGVQSPQRSSPLHPMSRNQGCLGRVLGQSGIESVLALALAAKCQVDYYLLARVRCPIVSELGSTTTRQMRAEKPTYALTYLWLAPVFVVIRLWRDSCLRSPI